jgi:YVTN family beta-propeller protein
MSTICRGAWMEEAMKRIRFVLVAALALLCLGRSSECEAAAYAYVANRADNTVSIIQISNNEIIATVQVGKKPVGVAVTPNGDHVYVVNRADNSVSAIETFHNTIDTAIPVGNRPGGIAVTPDGEYIYVTNRDDGTVSVIQTSTNAVNDLSTVGTKPFGAVVIPPDGNYVYVANRADGTISVIETSDNTVTATIDVGDDPVGVAVTPDGLYVYVTNHDDNTVSVIQTSDYTVISTIGVGNSPFGVAVTPDGPHVYVANSDNDTVSVIQTSDHTVIDTIDVGISPFGVAVTPDGARVYVTNSEDNTVSVIQTSDHTVYQIDGFATPTSLGEFIVSISVPEAPSDLTASTESESQIDLSWADNSFDETGFKIERKAQSEETYIEIDDVDANGTSYSDTGLEPYTTYTYRVRAYNNHGNSDYSDEAEATTAIILEAPTNLTATGVSHSRIRLSWTDNSFGESGFTIERMTVSEPADSATASAPDSSDSTTDSGDSNGTTSETVGGGTYTEIAKVGADVTSYSDGDLEPYTTYRYRVQAYGDDNAVSDWSNEVEKRTKDDCFIATAAYGSLMEPHVVTLRRFRDAYLIPHTLGRVFVRIYYQYSPPIAHFISEHETLRAVVRLGLLPLVAFSYSMLLLGPTLTLTILVFVALFAGGLYPLCQREKRSHRTPV